MDRGNRCRNTVEVCSLYRPAWELLLLSDYYYFLFRVSHLYVSYVVLNSLKKLDWSLFVFSNRCGENTAVIKDVIILSPNVLNISNALEAPVEKKNTQV